MSNNNLFSIYARVCIMKPKKSLGQNFLTSIPAKIAIIKAGDVSANDTILEIGPGRGFLTEALVETGATVIALEKDRELIPLLREKFLLFPSISIIEGDVLTYEPPHIPYKLIANIPYYITGMILKKFLTHTNFPTKMVVLVQREVAERVVARDGKESILSLSVKAYGVPKLVYRVDKGSFYPIPSVDSAVLAIDGISKKNFVDSHHEEIFFKVIKSGFLHKRKFLLSNLKEEFSGISLEDIFIEQTLSPKVRAEDVTLSEWLRLSSSIATLL